MKNSTENRKLNDKFIDKIFDDLDPKKLERARFNFDVAMRLHDLLDEVKMNSFDLAKAMGKPQNIVDRQLMAMYNFEFQDILDIMTIIERKKEEEPEDNTDERKPNEAFTRIIESIPQNTQSKVHMMLAFAAGMDDAMKEKQVSKKELAKSLGVTKDKIAHYLSGTFKFSVEDMVNVRMALDSNILPI